MIEASQKLGTALGGRNVVMVTTRAERRLAAIMAADIVGYSRLIEADEAATLAAIKALRAELIDPLLAEHKGRIVKLMGDGALVEFAPSSMRSPAPSRCRQASPRTEAELLPSAASSSGSASISATWWSKATICSATA